MTNSKIIHVVKDGIAKAMESIGKDNVSPTSMSRTLAYILYLYSDNKITDNDIKDKNNPMGFINPSTGDKETFDSIATCIIRFFNEKISNEDFDLAYEGIAKANNLYRFDKEYLNKVKGSIIDLEDTKPNIDVYTVKEADSTEVTRTSNIEEAKQIKDSKVGRTMSDSKGRVIDGSVTPYKSKSMVSVDLKAGAKVECNGLNLYYKSTDKAPARSITGDYYLYDGREVNGRYAICLKPEFVGNVHTIIGYVEAKRLKK